MKKLIFFFGAILFIIMASNVQAQSVVDKRQHVQQARIAQGVRSGELTRSERRALKVQQRHIRRVERRTKADGVVTPAEKVKVTKKQNRANRNIRRNKND